MQICSDYGWILDYLTCISNSPQPSSRLQSRKSCPGPKTSNMKMQFGTRFNPFSWLNPLKPISAEFEDQDVQTEGNPNRIRVEQSWGKPNDYQELVLHTHGRGKLCLAFTWRVFHRPTSSPYQSVFLWRNLAGHWDESNGKTFSDGFLWAHSAVVSVNFEICQKAFNKLNSIGRAEPSGGMGHPASGWQKNMAHDTGLHFISHFISRSLRGLWE